MSRYMEEVNSTVKMVSEIGEEFPIVGKLFSIFNKIYEIADQAKQNIKNCKKAATRCKTYEKIICECIVAYKENGVDLSDRKHYKGVRDLKVSVEELKDLLEKYSKGSTFFGRFKKAKSFKDEFEEIDAEIQQQLQVIDVYFSKEAVAQNNTLLKRTEVLMDIKELLTKKTAKNNGEMQHVPLYRTS